jgi:hypothetical protein
LFGCGRGLNFAKQDRVTTSSNSDIASRIRGLLSGQGDLATLAARLHVDEVALRISIDELSPYPTVAVIAAVIREYAVDPSWLLTGIYRAATHREALRAATAELPVRVATLARRYGTDTPRHLQIIREA